MGGNAFAGQNLTTPRMSAEIYSLIKERTLAILRQHYKYADAPIEGPAKTDHGDIDVLVAEPRNGQVLTAEYLSLALDAQHHFKPKGSPTTHFALAWPDNPPPDKATSTNISVASPLQLTIDASQTQNYIQLDLHALPNRHAWTWLLFNQAYGDLWPILGSTLRRYGLTVNDQAFWVSIPELGDEGVSKKLRRVKITDDSSRVLEYLKLDECKYWTRFESWTALCEYAASMKFHNPARGKPKNETRGMDVGKAVDEKPETIADQQKVEDYVYDITEALRTMPGAFPLPPTASPWLDETSSRSAHLSSSSNNENDMTTKKNDLSLKSTDRRRVKIRPLFAYFVETYLPSHTDDPAGSAAHMTRAEVVNDLKSFFGTDFEERYDKQATHVIQAMLGDKLWAEMREYVQAQGVSGRELGFAVKGLKRGCGALPEKPHVVSLETAAVVAGRDAWAQGDLVKVKAWCIQNWQEMAGRERGVESDMEGLSLGLN